MWFTEKTAMYSDSQAKRINTFPGKNAELLNVKASGTCSFNCTLKGQRERR
jgi:hypothetical protein